AVRMAQFQPVLDAPRGRPLQPQLPGAGRGVVAELRRTGHDTGPQSYAGQPPVLVAQPEAHLGTGAPSPHRRFHDRTLTGRAGDGTRSMTCGFAAFRWWPAGRTSRPGR